jgi:paraquat-inducible protein B
MKQLHARAVGLFVVGALALVIAGLAAFGSRSYFENRPRAVTYFHGSVAGLAVGAPVTFRGVDIGQVVGVAVEITANAAEAHIPVIMEFDPERIATTNGGDSETDFIRRMIANQLAATLVTQSFITGQLTIELDYHPDVTPPPAGGDPYLPQIPEVRAGLTAMKDTIANLPIQELADNLRSILRNVNELVSGPEVRRILTGAAETFEAAAVTAKDARGQVDSVAQNLNKTADAIFLVAQRLDATLKDLQPKLGSSATDLDRLLVSTDQRTGQLTGDLHATLTDARTALADIHGMLGPRSAMEGDLQTLIHNIAAASGPLRSFIDQIDRNPNVLVMGGSHR